MKRKKRKHFLGTFHVLFDFESGTWPGHHWNTASVQQNQDD